MPSSTTPSIVEVSPRDGLQNDSADLTTAQKADLVERVVLAGARRVEVTSFVSPKAVPKMADAEALMDMLAERSVSVSTSGLVVNERGVRRAAAAGVNEINIVILASDTFNLRNQGVRTAESLSELPVLMGAARSLGMGVAVTIGASFGCPFEGEVPIGRLAEVAEAISRVHPDEISLADTIGVAVPDDVTTRSLAVRDVIAPEITLRAHFHNTRNTGIANAVAALRSGVTVLDSSLGGVGGCPFAPAATGNIATEDLIYVLDRSGIASGLDLEMLIASASWFAETLAHGVPGMVSKAGPFPAAHADVA